MATYDEVMQALRLADQAGNADDARRLAEMARSMQPSQTTTPQQPAPLTLQDRAQDVFGFNNYTERHPILPFGMNEDGSTELAMPQVGVDMLTSFLLPGHVAQGGSYTGDDVTRFALDYAVPATAGNPMRPAAMTKREFIQNAPSTEDLSSAASPLFTAARGSGAAVSGERYVDFLANLETRLATEGVDKMLHPKVTAVFDSMSKRLGEDPTIADLMTIRRQIGIAANSTAPELADERRIAGIMRDQLDGLIDNLGDGDLVSGTVSGVSDNLAEGRALWSRAKKSEIIDDVIARADNQASGVENGLRIGFRQLLNNKKLIRGFSPEEVAAIKDVVAGTPSIRAMRLLGKLSFGTKGNNFLGGSIGVTGGAAALGPFGAAAAPVLGYAAQKGADAATRRSAELARAMAATGTQMPNGGGRLTEMMLRGLPPVVGAQNPQVQPGGNRLADRLRKLQEGWI